MNAQVRDVLANLIRTHGQGACADPRRCTALLRDCCPGHGRETHLLGKALELGVAHDLLVASRGVPEEILVAQLTQRLVDELAVAEDAARWTVESWLMALRSPSAAPSGRRAATSLSVGDDRGKSPGLAHAQPITPTAAMDETFPGTCPGCNKNLRLKAASLGRKVRCPSCRVVFHLASDAQAAGKTERNAPSPRIATCANCGKAYRIPARYESAQKMRCKGCGQEIDLAPAMPKKGRRSMMTDWMRACTSRRWVAVLAAAVFLGCVGMLVVPWLLGLPGKLPPDTVRYLPKDCQVVVSVRLDDATSRKALARLQVENSPLAEEFRGLVDALGADMAKMERLTAAFGPEGRAVFIVHLNSPMSGADIRTGRKPPPGAKILSYEETKIGDLVLHRAVYDSVRPATPATSFCLPHERLLLSGDPKDLRAVIEREQPAEIATEMRRALERTDFSATVAAAVDLRAVFARMEGNLRVQEMLKAMPGSGKYLANLRSLSGVVRCHEEQIEVEVALTCADEKIATELVKLLEGVVLLTDVVDVEVPKAVRVMFASLRFSRSEAVVTIAGQCDWSAAKGIVATGEGTVPPKE